jgi:hypothetical protein
MGEISYGGRVTDVWDMRTLQSIFKLFFCRDFLNDNFNITSNGDYRTPSLDISYDDMELFVKAVCIFVYFICIFPIVSFFFFSYSSL